MTKLTKEMFTVHAGYVCLIMDGKEQFLARFKYGASSSARPFVTFLCKNFSMEFVRNVLDQNQLMIAPMMREAEKKGFLLSHLKKWVKADGYEPTQEGYKAWFKEVHMPRVEASRLDFQKGWNEVQAA